MRTLYIERTSDPRWPRVMRWRPARAQRSVDRGTRRPGSEPLRLSASIGIAEAGPGASAEQLLCDADIAMYSAKYSQNSNCVRYEPAMGQALARRTCAAAQKRPAPR